MPSKVGEADSTFVGQDAWPKGKTAPENSFLTMWKTVKKPNKKWEMLTGILLMENIRLTNSGW